LPGGLAAAPILSLPVRVLEPAARAVGMGIFFTLFYVHVVIGPWIGGALATMAGTSRVTFDLGCRNAGAVLRGAVAVSAHCRETLAGAARAPLHFTFRYPCAAHCVSGNSSAGGR
jgi:hypothetical protein